MRSAKTTTKEGNGNESWYACRDGLSPAKSLGLSQDTRRCAMTFCTARRLLRKVNGKCAGCSHCELCEFYQVTKDHAHKAWVDLDLGIRGKLQDLLCSPDFPALPGFSTFPEDPKQQERASIRSLMDELPDSRNLQACSELVDKLHQRAKNGWFTYQINRTLARAVPAAVNALRHEPLAEREADFGNIAAMVEAAKAEARKTGSATITIKIAEDRRNHFDSWAKNIQEYDKTGREFPFLTAIRESLLRFSCLRNVLAPIALAALGID